MTSEAEQLVEAFVGGARHGRSGDLYVEGDVLYVNGWWQAAMRVANDVFILRTEAPPVPVPAVDALSEVLRRRGLEEIPGEHPLIEAVTYAELSLVGVGWTLWAPDAARGEQALGHRAAPESRVEDWTPSASDHPAVGDLSGQFAASLVGGLPPSVILAIGLDDDTVEVLREVASACRVETSEPGGAVAACGRIVPHLVIIDAQEQPGRNFLLEFRREACGRHVPIAAVTTEEVPRGADTALDPRKPPSWWQDQLQRLLP